MPGNTLQRVISDEDIITIASKYVSDWEALAVHLGLNDPEKIKIRNSFPSDVEMQARKCLQKWKRVKGNVATYQALITAAEKANDRMLADNVQAMQ